MFPEGWYDVDERLNLAEAFGLTERVAVAAILLTCAVVAPVLGYAALGDRQRREAGGGRRRLWSVSVAATGLALLPFGIGLLGCLVVPTDAAPHLLECSLILSIIAGFGVAPSFNPPLADRESREPLPLLDDAAFLSRMSELAARMGLRLPVIRMFRSKTAEQDAQAWAGSLPQPSLVVSDGILHRLEPIERDTILAHEMAHVVNGSLWIYAAFMPIACSVGVAAVASHVATWPWIVPATYIGAWRFLARRLEYDCDLRAARAVGFPETATALSKIHKIGWGSREVWSVRLLFATGGHPALASRLAHLIRNAPKADGERMPELSDHLPIHSRLGWCSAGVWLVTVATGWRLGQSDRVDSLVASVVLLTVISVLPRAINYWAAWKNGVALIPRVYLSRDVVYTCLELLLIASGGLGLLFRGFGLEPTLIDLAIPLGMAIAGVGLLIRRMKRSESRREFDRTWSRHDFAALVAMSKDATTKTWLARDTHRRCQVAMAKTILGRIDESLEDFEQLDLEGRLNENRLLWLASIQIEAGRFEAALTTAERIKVESPSLALGEALAARALRRLGRLDEARQQSAFGLNLNPGFGALWAAAAGIETELGNYGLARDYLRRAQDIQPGTPQELAEVARLALRTEPPDVAKAILQRAIAAYEANPLMLRQSEIDALRALLVTPDHAMPIDPGATAT